MFKDSRVVTAENFERVLASLLEEPVLAFDTETTGLRAFHGDEIFSIILGTDTNAYYFNFHDYNTDTYTQHRPEYVLPRSYIRKLQPLFDCVDRIMFVHNAKFDSHMVRREGIEIDCKLWCTETGARVEFNDHMKYGLAECAERIGESKDDAVEDYIKKHKLWEWVRIPGKKKREKNKFYVRVPFEIIKSYGIQDVVACFRLGRHQQRELAKTVLRTAENRKTVEDIMEMEMVVTKACTTIENVGMKIDVDFIKRGVTYYQEICTAKEEEFEELTGMGFKDSNKVLALAFTNMGLVFPTTEKGNPSFKDEVLQGIDNPIAKIVQEWRGADKILNTYFRSFMYWMDAEHVIHPDLRQAGTGTGRFSCRNPNLQNVPKDGVGEFKVRKAFVPREGYCFVAIDYNQMEFRLMLEYAKEMELIDRIMKGHDPHTATAELVGIDRRPAKTLNFGLLYGMGIKLLAETLGVSVAEAKRFKDMYFGGLPRVKSFLRKSTRVAEQRGHVFDWAGRRFHYPDPKFAYKAANSIIQGGCSSVVKKAMCITWEYLQTRPEIKSRPIMQIHDEILFEVHKDELGIEDKFKEIMESVYPYKHIPLTCSVEHSFKSWGELSEGSPKAWPSS